MTRQRQVTLCPAPPHPPFIHILRLASAQLYLPHAEALPQTKKASRAGAADIERERGKIARESHILTDFSECMYGYEDKLEFEEAFGNMRHKEHKQTWLDSIYKEIGRAHV